MKLRLVSTIIALAVVAGLTSGCVPEPTSSPSPTGFATEEEAFAAAEATYRAYVDALNQVDLSDPETFEAVYAWTTGELNATDRKGLTAYHAEGAKVSGTTTPTLVELSSFEVPMDSVSLATCIDVSTVDVVNADGISLVDPDRTDVQSLIVTLIHNADSKTGLVIESIGPREGGPSCDS